MKEKIEQVANPTLKQYLSRALELQYLIQQETSSTNVSQQDKEQAADILKNILFISDKDSANSDVSTETSDSREENPNLTQSNQAFYIKDEDIVQNIVTPFINQTKKGFTTEVLDQFLRNNINKVCTALFNEEKDTDKISQFIEKFYNCVDNENDKQVNLYNDLYNLSNDTILKPKEADGRWTTYDDAHTNCEYMHLFSLVVENISIDDMLMGQLNVQPEDMF